jgi:hypothetical protein
MCVEFANNRLHMPIKQRCMMQLPHSYSTLLLSNEYSGRRVRPPALLRTRLLRARRARVVKLQRLNKPCSVSVSGSEAGSLEETRNRMSGAVTSGAYAATLLLASHFLSL